MLITCSLTMLLVLLCFLFYASKHYYLTALLILEGMMLVTLTLILFIFWIVESNMFIFVLVLTIGVCEAGMALSLMMSFIKNSGSANMGAKLI
uniref:NADH dehydrogenase subunit 4L n=1 Tax=Megalophaedusa fukudainadai TaxID=1885864 RepID=A0A224ABK7_9EUPU|nr:NADH dehydrogenase subunit 4L [Megalophaedusa fukudainadai]